MHRYLIAALLVSGAANTSSPVMAATSVYDFSFTSTIDFGVPVGSFSGQFIVDNDVIVGISGSGAGIGTITDLFTPGAVAVDPDFAPNDNLFSSVSPFLSFNGVTFSTTNFPNINLFFSDYDLAPYRAFGAVDNGTDGDLSVQLSPTSGVPEPATWATMLLGFGMIGSSIRYRLKPVRVAFA